MTSPGLSCIPGGRRTTPGSQLGSSAFPWSSGRAQRTAAAPAWDTRLQRKEKATQHLSNKQRNTPRRNSTGARVIQKALRMYLTHSQIFNLDFNCSQRPAPHMYRTRHLLFSQVLQSFYPDNALPSSLVFLSICPFYSEIHDLTHRTPI